MFPPKLLTRGAYIGDEVDILNKQIWTLKKKYLNSS